MPHPNLALVGQQPKPMPVNIRKHATDMEAQLGLAEPFQVAMPKLMHLCRPSSNRLWVLGGEPGSFKTKLAWRMALTLARLRRNVLFVSLEMHPTRLVLMHHAAESGLEERRIVNAFEPNGRPFDANESARYSAAVERWNDLGSSLWIHDPQVDGWKARDVMHSIDRVGWDAVFVDHGRLLAQDNLNYVAPAVEGLRQRARGSKRRPWIVAVWPLNGEAIKTREDEKPRLPRISDLWGGPISGYAADTVVVLQKRAKLDDEAAVVPVDAFVIKNRDGPEPHCIALEANGRTSVVVERCGETTRPDHWSEREPGEEG